MSVSRPTHRLIKLPPATQQTDSHCGPATIQTLFAYLKKTVTQDQVVTAARAKTRLAKHGTRPDQLARAVAKLAPDLQFWIKEHTTKRDMMKLLHEYRWPVAINWQGLFYDSIEEEKTKNTLTNTGHYSMVIGINPEKDTITIADPYHEYSQKPRVFSLKWFERRWWDEDCFKDASGKENKIKTKRLIFVITPKNKNFPAEVGMRASLF